MLVCHPQWLPRPARTQLYSALLLAGWTSREQGCIWGGQKEWFSSVCLSTATELLYLFSLPFHPMHVPRPADRPEGALHPKILEEPLDFVHLLIHRGNLRETNHKKSGG